MKVNIHDAKTNLSRYLEQMQEGEVLTLCKRNEPVAELRKLSKSSGEKRVFGCDKGKIRIDKSFFAPLPEDVAQAFEGKAE